MHNSGFYFHSLDLDVNTIDSDIHISPSVLTEENNYIKSIGVDDTDITFLNTQEPALKKVLTSFAKVFEQPPHTDHIPKRPHFDQQINLQTNFKFPHYGPLRPMNEKHLAALKVELEKLLANGRIRPSTSTHRSHVMLVPKKDGGYR
ncbi:hypothetical protein HK099_003422, partial [Clydaea vesicula]